MIVQRGAAIFTALLIIFAIIANGAHDLWASTLVYATLLLLLIAMTASGVPSAAEGVRLPLIWPALAVVTAMAFSFRTASNPSEAYLGFMDWIALLVMFFIGANVFAGESRKNALLAAITPVIFFEVALMAVQLIAFNRRFHGVAARPEQMGTLINGNFLAAFFLFWIPPLVERARSCRLKPIFWFWLAGLIAALTGLYCAQSTAAWLSLLMAVPFLFGWRELSSWAKTRWKTLFFFKLLFVSAAAAVIIWKFRFTHSLVERLQWWKTALAMFRDHPWLGVGVGNFPSAFLSYKAGPTLNTLYAHGFWFALLAETGVAGFLAVLLFVGRTLVLGARNAAADGGRWAFFMGLVLFGVNASVGLGAEVLVNMMIAGLFAGMIVAPSAVRRFKPRWSACLIFGALVAAILPSVVSPFFASRSTVDGQRALSERDWPAAERSFRAAAAMDPRSWEPYEGLARVAYEQGDFKSAEAYQRQAVERNSLQLALKTTLESYQRRLR